MKKGIVFSQVELWRRVAAYDEDLPTANALPGMRNKKKGM